MVIDVHGHMCAREHWPEAFWQGMAKSRWQSLHAGKSSRIPEVPASFIDDLFAYWKGIWSDEQIVAYMDAAGVEKMAMLAIDMEVRLGLAERSIVDQNKDHANLAAAHPNRLVAVCGVDPQRGQFAYDLFDKAIGELGVRGLKLHTTTGFLASDRCAYPLYEIAEAAGLPVFIHCGSEFPPLRSGQGLNAAFTVDAAAGDFPKVNFVLAHLGTGSMMPLCSPWIDGAIYMASYHRNVYLDFASKQRSFVESPIDFYRGLRRLMDSVPISRLLFASDCPFHEKTLGLKQWIAVFREPDPGVLENGNVTFDSSDMEAILGRNAREELGL